MKKILALIFILILFPIISAVEFEGIKSNYSQGETLITKFSANFVNAVVEDNIKFYRNHNRVSIEPHLTKIGEEYHLYAQLPEREDNYSLRLENIKYFRGSSVIDENVIQNFTITNKTADFSVVPGFVVTPNEFDLQIQNLNEKKITISLKIESLTGVESSYFLPTEEFAEGEEKNFSFITGAIEKIQLKSSGVTEDSLKKINLFTNNTNYEIPLYVLATPVSNKKEKDMRFNFKEFQIKIPIGEKLVKITKLQNIGQETLENIEITFSEELVPYLEMPLTKIEKLKPGEEAEIGFYFAESFEEKVVEGQVRAQADSEINAYTGIMIIYLKDYELSEAEEPDVIKTCLEMGGKICGTEEECSGEFEYAKDGLCCKGICVVKKSTSYSWLGWLLLIIVVGIIGWFFFKKYRGVKSETKLPFNSKKPFSNYPEKFPLKPIQQRPISQNQISPRQVQPKPISEKLEEENFEDEDTKEALRKLQEFKKKYGKR